MIRDNRIRHAVRRFFEGEPADPNAGQQQQNQNPPQPPPSPPKTYTETQFNELLNRRVAEDRRKAEDKNKQLVTELTTLRESSNLNEEQKQSLQHKIEELESTYRTVEEQKKIEVSQWQSKYEKDTGELTKKAQTWEGKHNDLLTKVDINSAAIKYEAYDPEQIEAILKPHTKVTEKDGVLVPRVKFNGRDAEGKAVQLDLSVDEAVKAMFEWPEKYGNQFKNTMKSGLGQQNNNGNGTAGRFTASQVENLSPQEYKKHRTAILTQVNAAAKG